MPDDASRSGLDRATKSRNNQAAPTGSTHEKPEPPTALQTTINNHAHHRHHHPRPAASKLCTTRAVSLHSRRSATTSHAVAASPAALAAASGTSRLPSSVGTKARRAAFLFGAVEPAAIRRREPTSVGRNLHLHGRFTRSRQPSAAVAARRCTSTGRGAIAATARRRRAPAALDHPRRLAATDCDQHLPKRGSEDAARAHVKAARGRGVREGIEQCATCGRHGFAKEAVASTAAIHAGAESWSGGRRWRIAHIL